MVNGLHVAPNLIAKWAHAGKVNRSWPNPLCAAGNMFPKAVVASLLYSCCHHAYDTSTANHETQGAQHVAAAAALLLLQLT
jgi:hypothetical protein